VPSPQLELSKDDTYLFSTSDDGSVFALQLVQTLDGVELLREGPDVSHHNMDAVVVSKEEMLEKLNRMKHMEKKLEELQHDNEYALHVKDGEWAETLKIQKGEFEGAIAGKWALFCKITGKGTLTSPPQPSETGMKFCSCAMSRMCASSLS
jgi:hypothetical protein